MHARLFCSWPCWVSFKKGTLGSASPVERGRRCSVLFLAKMLNSEKGGRYHRERKKENIFAAIATQQGPELHAAEKTVAAFTLLLMGRFE